jgi:glycolate oxidase FAD binding subunit
VLRGLDDLSANRAMTAALGSPFDVSGAAHLPGSATVRGVLADLGSSQPVTLLRLEGITASAAHRAASLAAALAGFGTAEVIEDGGSAELWAAIRDCAPFAAQGAAGGWPVWRIVCPPASGGALGMAVRRECAGEVFYDWGGGLIWAALAPSSDAGAGKLRPLVDAAGGHATLIRGSEPVRREVDVFHPQAAGLAALSERIRHSFDPKNILNRGRMARGLAT